jgi:hypothetical protein
MKSEPSDQGNVGTLIRVESPGDAGILKTGTVYLIYDQKGCGLDLVNLSSSEVPYLRVLESDRQKHFGPYPASNARDLLTNFLAQRASLIEVITGIQIGELIETLRNLPGGYETETGVALIGALKTIAKFERDLKDLENHVDFLAEFPSLEIDIDKPVRRRDTPSQEAIGSVVGLKKSETSVIACVQWANGEDEDIDVEDLVNAD